MTDQPRDETNPPEVSDEAFQALAQSASVRDERFALALLAHQVPVVLQWARQRDDLDQFVEAVEYGQSRPDRGLVCTVHLPQVHFGELREHLRVNGWLIGRITSVEVKSYTGSGPRGAVFMLDQIR